MTTIDEAKNMRSGINVEGTVERKSEVRNVNTKAGSTVDVADAMMKLQKNSIFQQKK